MAKDNPGGSTDFPAKNQAFTFDVSAEPLNFRRKFVACPGVVQG